MDELPDLMDKRPDLTMGEAAVILGCNARWLSRQARLGKLPGAYKLGVIWKIPHAALDKIRGLHEKDGES